MAKSQERGSSLSGWVAAGVLITAVGAGGKEHAHHHKAEEHIKDPRNVTVQTRASVPKFEKLFGCDIQDDLNPDHTGKRWASPKEKACAQHIAYIIGKNTYGWDKEQQRALRTLWTHESAWSANADNEHSSAYGIPQAMTSTRLHGPELHDEFGNGDYSYYKNPVSQIQWGLQYIHERYGTPQKANEFWHDQCDGNNGCWY